MTKELSRQLCELCWIEAKPLGCTNNEVLDTDCKGDCIDCTWYDNDLYYPDFGQPENFVKLLELPETQALFKYIVEREDVFNRQYFLSVLVDMLTNEYFEISEEDIENLQQRISEAEWKYE